MLSSILSLASSLVLLCKIFLAVVIDHLVTNLFFVISSSFLSKFSNFCILSHVKDSPRNDLILSNCSLFLMISFSCLSLSGVRELIIKFVYYFAFDSIASITCPLVSSHSITKLNSIGFSISVFPPTTAFYHMFLQSPELCLCCHAFPYLLLFQGPHEIVFFQIINCH